MTQKTALKWACTCLALAVGGLLLAPIFPWLTVCVAAAGAWFSFKAISDQRGLGTMGVTFLMTANLVLICVALLIYFMQTSN